MKNKLVPIIIVAVLVIGGITGIVLANVIGGDDSGDPLSSLSTASTPAAVDNDNDTSGAASTAVPDSSTPPESMPDEDDEDEEKDLLPEDVSAPIVGEDTSAPENTIDTTANFSEGDFYAYFLDFSYYFHDKLTGVDDLRSISSYSWTTASFVANYTWSYDYGQGVEYPYDSEGHALIPISRLSEGCQQIFGFPYDFAELANGDYGYMVVDGSFAVPNGYDMMGSPYADLSTAQLTVKDTTITVDVAVVQADFDNANPAVYGNFRYTFTLDNNQGIVPYRLVSIQPI